MLTAHGTRLDLDADPRPALGQVIEQTHQNETGFPLVGGLGAGALAVVLVVGGVASAGTSMVLAGTAFAIGVGLAWLGTGLLRDFARMRREDSQEVRVAYGLDGVRVTAAGMPERVLDLGSAFDHPLGPRASRRLRALMQARTALKGEPAGSGRRRCIELAALHHHDFPQARTVYVAFPSSGARIFEAEAAAREFVSAGTEVWAVAAGRTGPQGTWRPKLSKRAARRYTAPYVAP